MNRKLTAKFSTMDLGLKPDEFYVVDKKSGEAVWGYASTKNQAKEGYRNFDSRKHAVWKGWTIQQKYNRKYGANMNTQKVAEELSAIAKLTVTAGSYEEFISNYGQDIKRNLTKLHMISNKIEDLDEAKINKIFNKIERTYDKPVSKLIDNIIFGGAKPSVRDVAKVAIEISNRYGTEMQMVVNAMDDAVLLFAYPRLAKKEVPEAFKKQWKNKDKDNDGKENEPKPDFLKKKSSQAAGMLPDQSKLRQHLLNTTNAANDAALAFQEEGTDPKLWRYLYNVSKKLNTELRKY